MTLMELQGRLWSLLPFSETEYSEPGQVPIVGSPVGDVWWEVCKYGFELHDGTPVSPSNNSGPWVANNYTYQDIDTLVQRCPAAKTIITAALLLVS